VGVSGHNLIDIAKRDFPRYYVGSLNLVSGVVSAAADLRWQPGRVGSPFTVATGAEVILGNLIPVRAGWNWDVATQTHSLSAGLGFMISGGGVDVAYMQGLFGRGSSQLALTIKLQMQ
jgi:hypothetical protein